MTEKQKKKEQRQRINRQRAGAVRQAMKKTHSQSALPPDRIKINPWNEE